MKKIYIRTSKDELVIKNVEEKDISINEKLILFGSVVCVNLNEFISYQFVEENE